MEDILLLQFLKKKGIITANDMHEFHELTQYGVNDQMYEKVYLNTYKIDRTAVWPPFCIAPNIQLPSFYNTIFQEEIDYGLFYRRRNTALPWYWRYLGFHINRVSRQW